MSSAPPLRLLPLYFVKKGWPRHGPALSACARVLATGSALYDLLGGAEHTSMDDLQTLTQKIVAFCDERDWSQFHNPKDLALSLSLEASELLEIFQWKEGAAVAQVALERKGDVANELADVLYWTLLMAHRQNIDLASALEAKLESNAAKYPVAKARGSAKKYTEL
jgi:dCTP diphosphatase